MFMEVMSAASLAVFREMTEDTYFISVLSTTDITAYWWYILWFWRQKLSVGCCCIHWVSHWWNLEYAIHLTLLQWRWHLSPGPIRSNL